MLRGGRADIPGTHGHVLRRPSLAARFRRGLARLVKQALPFRAGSSILQSVAELRREGDRAMAGENAPGHTVGLSEQVRVRWLIRSDGNTVERQIGWVKLQGLPTAVVGIVSPVHRGTAVFAKARCISFETGKADTVTGAEAAGAAVSEPVEGNRRRTAFAAGRIVVLGGSHSCPSPLGSLQPGSSTPWSGCVPPAAATAYIAPPRHLQIRPWDPKSPRWRRLRVPGVRARSHVDTSSAVHTAVVAVRHLPCH